MIHSVLIVDDAPAVVTAVTMALGALGIKESQIRSANNAADAKALVEESEPDLIFLDVGLGDDHGEVLAQEWLAERSHLRIVMVTGLDPGDPRVRDAVSAGAYDVLSKPVRFQRVRELLDTIASEVRGLRRL